MAVDPFANFTPREDDKLPSLRVAAVGDTFAGDVERIGSSFATEYGDSYVIELKLTYVAIRGISKEIADAAGVQPYIPPSVGDTVAFFVPVGKHVDQEIAKATKAAGTNGLREGDNLAGKLIDLIKNAKNPTWKPFKKHAFIVTPGKPVDPFGEKAPF